MLVAGCGTPGRPGLELVRRSEPLLGTFVTITVYAPTRAQGILASSAAFDAFRRVDALMSVHRPDSELSRLNARAGHAREAVPSCQHVEGLRQGAAKCEADADEIDPPQ